MAGPEPVTDIATMTDLEFERRALDAIRNELGLGGLARFLMTHRSGKGDYTRDRDEITGNPSLAEIWRDLEASGGIQH